MRISLYNAKKEWLADEVAYDAGFGDVPILPIAGLFDPRKVSSISCSIDGYVSSMDQLGIVDVGQSKTGRKSCKERDGLNVDGGPDAQVEVAMFGRDWIALRFALVINHFFSNQETNFDGDVFAASLDGGPTQKIVVSGSDPQSATVLFTDLIPGLHQINYGPWAVFDAVRKGSPGYSAGYHNICLKI